MIPRAKLNSLLLICELVTSEDNALKTIYEFGDIYFRTDSSIVYTWVKNEHKTHKHCVQRRLNKIRNAIEGFDCLKLVPSRMNLADIATRAFFPILLSNSNLCFFGPEYLYSPASEWPNLQDGDNFSFPSTPNHDLINDVSASISCTNSDNFNEASSGLFETGNNVPSTRLTSANDLYDDLMLVHV